MTSPAVSLKSILQSTRLDRVDAKVLLYYLIDLHYQWPKSYLISHDQDILSAAFLSDWFKLEAKRQSGVPVAYLIQKKPFHQIDLIVSPDVLIPRPETEILVQLGLDTIHLMFQSNPRRFHASHPLRIIDLGCGSGAIILALAKELETSPFFESIHFIACDISLAALNIAQQNAQSLCLSHKVQFFESNWFDSIPYDSLAVILSNPPYLSADDPHLQQGDLRFEPVSALSDFADGLSAYRTITVQASQLLCSGGYLLFEHGFSQAHDVQDILRQQSFLNIFTEKDYSGLDRVTWAQKE